MFRGAGGLRVLLILSALSAAVVLPVISSGYMDVSHAENAFRTKDYAGAAQYYESAARRLPWKAELWERTAFARVYAGNDPGAIALFEPLSQRGTLSADGWAMYGELYYASGSERESLQIWFTGLHRYPSYKKFYYLISQGYHRLGNYPAEQEWLERWLSTGMGGVLDHFEFGMLVLASDPERARLELERASSMDAGFDSAVETLQTALDLAARETDDSHRLVILGRGLGLVNEWPLALSAFEQALKANQQNPEAWAWLGEAQQQTGTNDGRYALNRALSLGPESTLVHALRGLYWKRHSDYAAELAEYKTAAQLEPGNPEWQAALGEAYTLTGDLVSALASYQKAASLAPQNPAYWRLLALFSADNGVQVLEIGLPAARRAQQLAPNDPQVLDALGWSFSQAGLLYNAEQTLLKAASIAPDSALPHLHLAETYLRTGDRSSAFQQLNLVVQLDGEGSSGQLARQLLHQYFP